MTKELLKSRGRPRGFDRNEALDTAMRLFWTHGYEPTSVGQLADAMGIAPPSFYAAYGNKQSIFLECVDSYQARFGSFFSAALSEEPTAFDAVGRLLRDAAILYSEPGLPQGCMVVSAATNCSGASSGICENLSARRQSGQELVLNRIENGINQGELPRDSNAEALAGFVIAVLHGLSIAARDGTKRDLLLAIVDTAMNAWPDNSGDNLPT